MKARRFAVMAWRESMIRTVILGWRLRRNVAEAMAFERFEAGGWDVVEVREVGPSGVTRCVLLYSRDIDG